MDELTLTLNNPLSDEDWDMITDVDFDHTNRIWFHTKHGKEVEFVKLKHGKWIKDRYCSCCEWDKKDFDFYGGWVENYCPDCGAKMDGGEKE